MSMLERSDFCMCVFVWLVTKNYGKMLLILQQRCYFFVFFSDNLHNISSDRGLCCIKYDQVQIFEKWDSRYSAWNGDDGRSSRFIRSARKHVAVASHEKHKFQGNGNELLVALSEWIWHIVMVNISFENCKD